MRVLIVSGIWPPDVGGPASHAPEVAAFLAGRGHDVEVVDDRATRAGAGAVPGALVEPPAARSACDISAAPPSSRGARGAADVVYTTGMFARSARGAGARAARRSSSS